jgi:hypothetical protein
MRALRWSAILWVCAIGADAWAQTWGPAGQPGLFPGIFQDVMSNEAQDTVYLIGDCVFDTVNVLRRAPLRYSNGQWDTLGDVRGTMNSAVIYNDTLIIGGQFTYVDGIPCEGGVAYWDENTGWHPFGDLENSVRQLRIHDGELYAVGAFDLADGTPAPAVAKRVGGSWIGVGQIAFADPIFLAIEKYGGELVVIGSANVNGIKGIFHLVGNDWLPLGPGIQGGQSGARSLAVYDGDLYVAGQFNMSTGNVGQDIMRWDGTQFHPVGLGLQLQLGDFTTFSLGECMIVQDGLLWVGGSFNYAGGVEARGVATWDGTQWCGVGGDIEYAVHGMAFYRDTLFISCGWTIDGDSVWNAAKFIGASYVDTCSGPVGVLEATEPSPVSMAVVQDALVVTGLPDGRHSLVFYDALGRIIWATHVISNGEGAVRTRMLDLPAGCYVVSIPGLVCEKLMIAGR